MSKTKEQLWKDYEDVNDRLKVVDVNDPKYDMLLRQQDGIMSKIVKLEELETEAEMKKAQIEADGKKEVIRIAITVVGGITKFIFVVKTVDRAFKFDETSTMTSTLGRFSLTSAISSFLKWK